MIKKKIQKNRTESISDYGKECKCNYWKVRWTDISNIIKKNQKLAFKQRIQKLKYSIKKAFVERTIKAESHTLDEVMKYILTKHGFKEASDDEVKMEHNQMRASFIMQMRFEKG